MSKYLKYRHYAYYFFLIAGGIWHYLGYFKTIMTWSPGPIMILIGIISILESPIEIRFSKKYLNYLLDVAFFAFLAEAIGTHKGWIFGEYFYGNTLMPSFFGVPIAIGFAWLSTLLCSSAITNLISNSNIFVKSFLVALLMTFFDIIMEPAAIALSYWTWVGGSIPLFNYVSWFVLSYIFAFIGFYKFDFSKINSMKLYHLFMAQLIYFLIVELKFFN